MAVELLIVSLWLSLATLQRNGGSLISLMKEHSGPWLTIHFNNTMSLWTQNAQVTRVVHPGPWFIPTGTPLNFRDVPVGTNLSLKSLVCWGSPSKLMKLERKKVSKSQNPHEQIVWCHAHENRKLWWLLKVCQLRKGKSSKYTRWIQCDISVFQSRTNKYNHFTISLGNKKTWESHGVWQLSVCT